MEKSDLMRRYGSIGARLYHLARGEDVRHVSADDESKSVGAETTFNEDIAEARELERILWRMCERVSRRAKADGVAGVTVVLKLKTADFRIRTRNTTLDAPTFLASRIFDAARPLLMREAKGTAYRLLGVAISHLSAADPESFEGTLDAAAAAKGKAELAMDRLRAKFGEDAVKRGLGLQGEDG
jgi:DNA polymerase-4